MSPAGARRLEGPNNVASGYATTNAEAIAAVKKIVPDTPIELPTGGSGQQNYLDITRIQQDTGYRPAYDTETAVADYISWLRYSSTTDTR